MTIKTFDSVLVANRGEIAVRIMRTAQAMGLKTIAVYSEADVDAPHVAIADDAVCIGAAPVGESYLNADRVLEAAAVSGAQAIHPGYGFLSENAGFARSVEAAGLVFIGPGANAIELMGDKAAAKRRMIAAGVPCVPGYEDEDQADSILAAAAAKIGFPVMVKATAGGGGRGMRLVDSAGELADALSSARSEALNAFGSDTLIIEKAVIRPRHVEIQVFADSHGNVIHLGERDCSVQRRHQKVVEEAPCPVLTDALREAMGAAAVQAARDIQYRGAGTVEFLLDDSGEFYFLEMNTRLQVEHPVTEMITDLDLVQMQLIVADGQVLPVAQEEVLLHGHAIEVRLYAEDPGAGFLPATGRVAHWAPYESDDCRVDSGIVSGQQVSPFYDPMLAKLIAWGPTRDEARMNLIHALKETEVFGVTTNRGFLIDILERKTFADGRATTAFLADEFSDADLQTPSADEAQFAIAAALAFERAREQAVARSIGLAPELLNWSSGDPISTTLRLQHNADIREVVVTSSPGGDYDVQVGGQALQLTEMQRDAGLLRLRIDSRRRGLRFFYIDVQRLQISENGRTLEFTDLTRVNANEQQADNGGQVRAPMHGVLIEILVRPGDTVKAGDRLAVLEAMKMQHDLQAGADGNVVTVTASEGAQVAEGDLVIEITTTATEG